MLRVALVTRGGAAAISGGHLFHRRVATAASSFEAELWFEQESWWWAPSPSTDVVVIDSIGAWRMLPSAVRGRWPCTVVAMVHQRPGGSDGTRLARWVKARLDLAVYRRCDLLIAASRTLADTLEVALAERTARVVVVEPGCDQPPARPVEGMRDGRSAAILSVANWYPNKGVLELIDAFAGLPAGLATLHLAGREDVDARYTARVRARLAAADVDGRVVAHGPVDPSLIGGLYAGADVFALATFDEGYATAYAEGLAHGLPVVGWRRPFLERFITDGVEGRMADPGDVPDLTRAFADVLANPCTTGRYRRAAAARGATLPTWNDTAAAFFTLLRRSAAQAVEPAQDRSGGVDVDATDTGVLHEEAPRQAR